MNEQDFNALLGSLREGARILKGAREPSRRFVYDRREVREIRESLSVSQGDFAALLGVSVNTVQNWEQGRRTPTGPARVLLTIVQHRPNILSEPWFGARRSFSPRQTLAHA